MKESKYIIEKIEIEEDSNEPLLIPAPMVYYLSPYPDLLGFYSLLKFFARKPFCSFLNQKSLSKLMGINYVTFLKRRNKLRDLGVLEFKTKHNNMVVLRLKGVLTNQAYYRATQILNTSGIENLNTPSKDEYEDLVEFTRKSVVPIGTKSDGPLFETDNIYNIYPNIINKYKLLNNNKYIGNNTKSPNTKAPKEKKETYPLKDYEEVLKGYMRYKGIVLRGPELATARRVIKLMFQAKRTPDQIIKFMKWLYNHEDSEEHGAWIRGKWNIWTVQKKIPEFLAGKLDSDE